jgi:hypothetical protein
MAPPNRPPLPPTAGSDEAEPAPSFCLSPTMPASSWCQPPRAARNANVMIHASSPAMVAKKRSSLTKGFLRFMVAGRPPDLFSFSDAVRKGAKRRPLSFASE